MVVAYMLRHTFPFVLLSALILFYIAIRIIQISNFIRIWISFQFIKSLKIVRDFYSQQPIRLLSQARPNTPPLSIFSFHILRWPAWPSWTRPALAHFLSRPAPVHHRRPSNWPSGHWHWEHAATCPTAAPLVQYVHAAVPTLCCAQEVTPTPWTKPPPPPPGELVFHLESGAKDWRKVFPSETKSNPRQFNL
jgi:hypothetical protein